MSEETEEVLPEPADLMTMDIDELGAMTNEGGALEDEEPVAEEATEPSDDDEAEPEEVEASPEEAEEETEEPVEAEATADDLELLRAEIALKEAALNEERTKREHFESLAGRHGGEVGYLRQQLEQREASLQHRPADDEYVEPEQPPRHEIDRWPDPGTRQHTISV